MDVLELIVLDRVFIDTGRVVMGALSIDSSGGGSRFADGTRDTARLLGLELLPF